MSDEVLPMTIHPPLDESSRIYLSNVLNEILHGFSVDYEKTLGSRRQDVLRLFQELSGPPVQSAAERISSLELKLLLKCSHLCLREFDAGEFETRLGASPAVARHVNECLSASMDAMPVPA